MYKNIYQVSALSQCVGWHKRHLAF